MSVEELFPLHASDRGRPEALAGRGLEIVVVVIVAAAAQQAVGDLPLRGVDVELCLCACGPRGPEASRACLGEFLCETGLCGGQGLYDVLESLNAIPVVSVFVAVFKWPACVADAPFDARSAWESTVAFVFAPVAFCAGVVYAL